MSSLKRILCSIDKQGGYIMVLTQDQIYDAYIGSWEEKLVDKLDKDIFGIRGMTPEEALTVLTVDAIGKKADEVATKVCGMSGNSLGLRKELLVFGLTERYITLRNTLETIGSDLNKASDEFIKLMLNMAPREFLLLMLNVDKEDESRDFNLGLYATNMHNTLLNATEDKKDVEILYFIKRALESEPDGLEILYLNVFGAIEKAGMLTKYTYESRYYNPDNLNMNVLEDIGNDVKFYKVQGFDIHPFIVHKIEKGVRNPLYIEYLNEIRPIVKSKALVKLWEDKFVGDILDELPEQSDTFTYGRYFYNNNIVVMLRDGLTVVEPNGEFTHTPSSKVTKKVKEEVIARLIG